MTSEPQTVKTTCPYCGVGCGILATPKDDGSVSIAGDPDHPANFGRLCSKGAALGETLGLEGRQLSPMVDGVDVDWDTALDAAASRLKAIIEVHGPNAVGLYGSGQLLTEDYYVANKLMKGFVGTANIDTNSRLCMASSVAAHKRAFGADTVPGAYEDFELADLIVLAGSNLAWCHPVLYQRILAAKAKRPDMRIVVIDPRRTHAAEAADLHLSIVSDGDVALFSGLLAHLVAANGTDDHFVANHTSGFDAALAMAGPWTIGKVANATGLLSSGVALFYDLFAATEKVVTIFSQGVNQSLSGTDKANAIINCHLATGRIGRPGMGPFSITGQPNAMGGREVGGLANMLAAHMDFEHADRVASFWNAPNIARKPGLKAVDLFDALAERRIKALWVMATNPVVSMPDADGARQAMLECDTVIVSDMYATTDTARCAAIFFPAAGWGEKSGTVTNSERRISRQRNFLPLPGGARPDWWIICEIAKRLGFSQAFDFTSPAEIFAEHAALSGFENAGTRDFDIAELASADYEAIKPIQWPITEGRGRVRHFADGKFYTPDGRARFFPTPPPPPKATAPGQLILNTGRVRDHWHTMTRTGNTARLSGHYAEPFVEIHPEDADRMGIRGTTLVQLQNERGRAIVRAQITDRQRKGTIFAPMHWTGSFSSQGRINTLVAPLADPVSGQPGLKMSAVSAAPEKVRFYGFAVSHGRPNCSELDYWALARTEGGWRTELAIYETPHNLDAQVERFFGIEKGIDVLTLTDARSGRNSFAGFAGPRLVFALWLSPDPVLVSRQWASARLGEHHDDTTARSAILSGRPGADRADPGPLVCSCFGVGANQIAELAQTGKATTVDAVGAVLNAGTNCGSCRTEIRRIIDAHRLQAAE